MIIGDIRECQGVVLIFTTDTSLGSRTAEEMMRSLEGCCITMSNIEINIICLQEYVMIDTQRREHTTT